MKEEYITPDYKTISRDQKGHLTELMQSSILNGFTEEDYFDVLQVFKRVIARLEAVEKEKQMTPIKEKRAEGEWVFDDYDESGVTYKCSCCERLILIPNKTYPKPEKCPICGANMKGE